MWPKNLYLAIWYGIWYGIWYAIWYAIYGHDWGVFDELILMFQTDGGQFSLFSVNSWNFTSFILDNLWFSQR